MRIAVFSPGPGHPTAYGQQTAIFAPRLAALGHQVVIAAMFAHPLHKAGTWEGLPIVGPAAVQYSFPAADVRAALGGDPDLILVIKDAWVLPGRQLRRWKTVVWTNIDGAPLGHLDKEFFTASGATAAASSKFALSLLRAAGIRATYIPHGIETGVFRPHPDGKDAAKAELGLPEDHFTVGINAQNVGIPSRKAWFEQMAGFASFHGKLRPKSLLLCHTEPEHPEGMNLRHIAAELGITDHVLFGSHQQMTPGQMVTWYQALDVLLNCTYGEGFGVPVVEAHACGVPVIATDCSALSEKVPPAGGWLVEGQDWWNPNQRARWVIPRIPVITAKLAHAAAKQLQVPPELAAAYDADHVTAQYWKPFLESL